MTTLIEVRDISKSYTMGPSTVTALDKVSLDIAEGEFVAIMGASGSGKSTLMNLIGCLDSPSSGEYYLNGNLVSEMDDDDLARIRNKEIGFVFQTFNLLARATALHNVELPLIYAGYNAKERDKRARAALAAVDLEKRMLHKPSELSGGQRQRVAIARALANDPPVILADEPTGNLDSVSSANVRDILRDLTHSTGKSVVAVTHDGHFAAAADRRIAIVDGRIDANWQPG